MRNYKRSRISFTIHFLHFHMKTIQREDAIQKAVRSKKLGYFFSQPRHRSPLRLQTGSTTINVKKSNVMSKIIFKTLWMRNYKRAGISFTFHFLHFFEDNSQRGLIPKSSTFQETGLFFQSAPRHLSPQSHPLRLQTGFHNNHCENVRMRNYKLARTSDFLQGFNCSMEKNIRENAIQKAIFFQSTVLFLFSVSTMPQKSTTTSSVITDKFQNKQNRRAQVKSRNSKFSLKSSECETTSDREFLLQFIFYTFIWKQFKERTQFKKQYVPRNWVIFLVSHATEAQKDSNHLRLQTGLHNNQCEKVRMRNYKLARVSDFLHVFNCSIEKIVRENAILKTILSKGLCYFLFESAPCHIKLQRPPLWSQTGFQKKQNRRPQIKARILMSKINFKTLWMRNYKRARFSFTFLFLHFFWENNSKGGRNPKSSTFQEPGLFCSQLHATEAL